MSKKTFSHFIKEQKKNNSSSDLENFIIYLTKENRKQTFSHKQKYLCNDCAQKLD